MIWEQMITIFYRTLFFYLAVLIVIRIMGKREVGQLSPFDLVVAIMIAESAAIYIEDFEKPLIIGLIPMATLMLAEMVLSYTSLKFKWFRKLITGTPSVLVEKGVIMEKEMRRIRYNINDLLQQLRGNDIFNIVDVEYAILETSGDLSVILKSDKRTLTPADVNIRPPYQGLPHTLICDGEVLSENLQKAGKDLDWLLKKIGEDSIGVEEVFLAVLSTDGDLYISKKNLPSK